LGWSVAEIAQETKAFLLAVSEYCWFDEKIELLKLDSNANVLVFTNTFFVCAD